jgi:DNA gyrase subunit A
MIINKTGLTIRMEVSDLRVMGRATQGVRLINIKGTDSIAAVTKVMKEEAAEEVEFEDVSAAVLEGSSTSETTDFDDDTDEETEENEENQE